MSRVDAVLDERGGRYGDSYAALAGVSQAIKAAIATGPNWHGLSADKRESLEAIAMKMARILSGDPDYDDNWVDIAGYAQLALRGIRREADGA